MGLRQGRQEAIQQAMFKMIPPQRSDLNFGPAQRITCGCEQYWERLALLFLLFTSLHFTSFHSYM